MAAGLSEADRDKAQACVLEFPSFFEGDFSSNPIGDEGVYAVQLRLTNYNSIMRTVREILNERSKEGVAATG